MIEKIKNLVGFENLKLNYELKKCSTFGIGGEAKFFITPASIDSLINLVEILKLNNVNFKVIGNASNLLFLDNGYDGAIISLVKLNAITRLNESSLLVASGTSLAKLLSATIEFELSGLEFSAGIPGTLGGAIVMNAGANGSEISSLIKSVSYYDGETIKTKKKEELAFDYRASYFLKNKKDIVLFAELELKKSTREQIEKIISINQQKRALAQPKERSAGCVFKKCETTPAGLLIDKVGLKGVKVGGAKISEVHANFIVNTGSATAEDVISLIKLAELEVYKQFNKKLELEIEII